MALLVLCAGFAASVLGDWSRRTTPALVDQAVPPKQHNALVRDPVVHATAAPSMPALDLASVGRRNARPLAGDPFEARGWTAPVEKPRQVVLVQAAPQLPPLPFTYLGKWTEGDQVAVILSREGRNYIAHTNEILDGGYRVDSIEPNRMTMTFLPLATQQTLSFDQASSAGPAAAAAVKIDNPDAVLHVVVPAQATVAEEFTILLSVDPLQPALIERCTVELAYDANVLNVVAAGTTRMPLGRPDPGRISVELAGGHIGHGGPSSAVRLRVVAAAATTTQLRLASPVAYADDRDLVVAVEGPNPHPLSIVSANRAK